MKLSVKKNSLISGGFNMFQLVNEQYKNVFITYLTFIGS